MFAQRSKWFIYIGHCDCALV